MSVLDKYLNGENFAGTGKEIDVDKWIARHSEKPVSTKTIITEENYNPEETNSPESKIVRELREHAKHKKEYVSHFKNGGTIADFQPKYKNISRPILPPVIQQALPTNPVDVMARAKQIDTIIVWYPNIAIDEVLESPAKNDVTIGIKLSESLRKRMGEVADKERRTIANLFQVILKKFVADNSDMPNYESAEKNDCQVATRITEDLKNRLNLSKNMMSVQLRGIIKMYLDKYE